MMAVVMKATLDKLFEREGKVRLG